MAYETLRRHAHGAIARARRVAPRNELPSVRQKIFHRLRPYAAVASLGEDAGPAPAPPAAEMTDAEWRRRMLLAQEGFVSEAQKFRAQDKTARIVQISATLAIPLAAAIWRVILNRKIE